MAALGLLASGVAVTSAIERSLLHRTDQQLHDAADTWAKPRPGHPLPPAPNEAGPGRPPTKFYVRVKKNGDPSQLIINDGDVLPDIPSDPPDHPITVGSVHGENVQWRALTAHSPAGTTTVALRLTDNQETVDRLILLQLIIGAIVLSVLGVAAYFVIRRSLRPLAEVERTAAAIAAGDLHRRVPVRGNNTEVDRLSVALNGMLAQIQRAFAATAASEEAARRSEDKMRRFVADASHELRTPLTTIRGFAELFRQGAAKDTGLLMSRIEGESARMGLLVEDLLLLARLDEQRPLDRKPVDLLALASDAVHDARATAPQRTIKLEVGGGPGTPEVMGDDARLRQVLANLMSNAITHTPPTAAVTLRVSTTKDQAVLEVRDTGPGLAEGEEQRIFERFYRTDTSRTRESGGTGLGLSIVAALVRAHEGSVSAKSTPGEGTTFTVRLPRIRNRDRVVQAGTVSP
ncbi:HAMP domain-containing histidine kinase [Skermania sp. ID1734]|uniref:sensor histidine kinase n=1 Tax=Skermania sp. ID1734 TaxID=2597516 RepID=UPI001180D617|nr:HAMP domain-containing sensor histidine kinase [Skermania sp. ID1734]TSD96659.1 HAMP domain-containing histidine kinase [Skermania sp. ID1734]